MGYFPAISVRGELATLPPEEEAKYARTIFVCMGEVSIYVNSSIATVNGSPYYWTTHVNFHVNEDIHFRIDDQGMQIRYQSTAWVDIEKSERHSEHINFGVFNSIDLDGSEGGILGEYHRGGGGGALY